jgi:hypothetical protein
VLEGVAGPGQRLLARTLTSPSGRFDARIPRGASRVLSVAYRAFGSEPGYAAAAHVSEVVSAAVDLRVSPRHASSTGTIVLRGHVGGTVPRSGVIVELLVHYRGAWEPFRTPRTDGRGSFSARYQFQGALGRFPFRAEVPSGQAGFPYVDGHSSTVIVDSG